MKPPPLFSALPTPMQVQIAGIGPLLVGAVCGFLLDVSAAGYWVMSGLGAAGGIAGGFEHIGARAGARRGFVAGVLFGSGMVIAHAISGGHALAAIPSPSALLIVITAAGGTLLGAIGGAARQRRASPHQGAVDERHR
jgi:hypothetical protein